MNTAIRLKRFSGLVIVTLILFGVLLPGGLNAKACEDGFMRCMSDPIYSSIHVGALYCGLGYLFCKKYVE